FTPSTKWATRSGSWCPSWFVAHRNGEGLPSCRTACASSTWPAAFSAAAVAFRAEEKSLGGTPYSLSIARVTSEVTSVAYRVEKSGARARNEVGRKGRLRPTV